MSPLSRRAEGRPRRALGGLALGLLAGLLAWAGQEAGVFTALEELSFDWRARALARPGPATGAIKVVAVDQASLDWASENFGLSWPWPRQVYVPLVEYLARAGARSLVLDLIFSEPSPLPGDDAALGRALAAFGRAVGAVMLASHSGAARAWPPELPAPPAAGDLDRLAKALPHLVAPRAILPVAPLAMGFARLGNVGEETDSDQVIRRLTPLRFFAGRPLWSLGLAAPDPAGEGAPRLTAGRLWLGGRPLPLDADGRLALRFRGPPGSHEKFSAAAVLQAALLQQEGKTPPLDAARFRDCHVFLGLTAPGLHDLRATPLGPLFPGVEIHATALDNLLSGDFLAPAPPGWAAAWLLALGLLGGLLAGLATRAWQGAAWFLVLPVLPVAAGFLAYAAGWWWPLAAPLAALLLGLLAGAIHNYAREGRERRFIKNAFRHYLSPEVVERLLADPSRLRLGGERRELSLFFSDLQGFTGISERLDPRELTALLNDYLTAMTDLILAAGGTLDKYEGDAIIAFWNAPLNQPDHAARALGTALACQAELARRQAEYAARAGGPLVMRIGLNCGPVVVGNLGSSSRFDYTVLGDAANLASRLEGVNKLFGSRVLASEAIWRAGGAELAGRELGLVKVVGRQEPVRVFEPRGPAGQVDPAPLAAFARGLAELRAGRLAAAREIFASLAPDPAARLYAERLAELMAAPGASWDGVWQLASK